MNLRVAALPTALQHFFSQLAMMLSADCLYKMSSSWPPSFAGIAVFREACPRCCEPPAAFPIPLWTHNEFPYEAVGIHRGTPAAHHHTLSFFIQGQLKVKGSIWY